MGTTLKGKETMTPAELEKDPEFMGHVRLLLSLELNRNWIIMKYLLLREMLGLMTINLDKKTKTIRARRLKKGFDKIFEYYREESRFADFYRALRPMKYKAVKLKKYNKVNETKITEFANIFKCSKKHVKNAVNSQNGNIAYIKRGRIYFDKASYSDLKKHIESMSWLDFRAEELAMLIVKSGYRINIDGKTKQKQFWKLIDKETIKILNKYGKRSPDLEPFESIPMEIYDIAAFVLVVQELSREMGADLQSGCYKGFLEKLKDDMEKTGRHKGKR